MEIHGIREKRAGQCRTAKVSDLRVCHDLVAPVCSLYATKNWKLPDELEPSPLDGPEYSTLCHVLVLGAFP